MCSKRKLSFPFEGDDQQENSPECAAPRTKQHFLSKDHSLTRANERSVLVESASPHRRNTPSRFEANWQALKKSGISSTQPDSPGDTSFSTCSLFMNTSFTGTKRRAKALPIVFQNSPRTLLRSPTKELRPSSSFQTSWKALKSFHSLNESSCTDLSEDNYMESSSLPVTQLVPDQSAKQYLPTSQKNGSSKQKLRFVKDGYADHFRRILKNRRMDQRHLNNRKATHTVQVVAISKECGLSLALVAPESGTNFNILLQKNQLGLLKIGTRLQFYLDPNSKPLQLKNKQLVYLRPHNIIVL
ncbi:uncharacterized protein LOC108038495 [Drosophila rhopaloa]|uniref:Uncharacterized protein LOC108038495 n=1 Tax=Drosophila rhopaloa TaxID=1041015 RepID=A0A6P4EBW5_DRORH|nr:uncharacterized protein LOC108038495 [Drosophila rhopaloa]